MAMPVKKKGHYFCERLPVPGVTNFKKKVWKRLVQFHRVEHVQVDHVAAGVVQAFTLYFFLGVCEDRELHGDTRGVAEHLLEFYLLGVHEERVRDLRRAEFLALAAVHAAGCDVGETDEVEHEVRGDLAWGDVRRVLGRAVDTVADRAGRDVGVALDAAGGRP